tara:strand:- start:2415 stop:2870 length:456 start_codon:yes stop_codon:yes gene_type:complete
MFSVDKNPYRLAAFGGLLISLLPAVIINLIAYYFPSTRPEELSAVSEFLSEGLGFIQLLFFAIIVFIIPPIEEFIFRGVLWKVSEWVFSPKWTWILISLAFAAVHMEPLHILGLLPFSFFVGWLRLKTNRLGPSVVAHTVNNAMGCLLMIL